MYKMQKNSGGDFCSEIKGHKYDFDKCDKTRLKVKTLCQIRQLKYQMSYGCYFEHNLLL